jgi:tetratricopeptide (TPR) repeat protein
MLLADLALGLLFAAAPATGSLSDTGLLAEAEAAYREGMRLQGESLKARQSFARAAACYERLRARGANNAALYTNLAQSYLLAGDLPQALLAYQRGLRLAPNDAHLQDLLEQGRNQVVYAVPGAFGRPPVDNWPPWLPRLSVRFRVVLTALLYTLACVCVTRWWMTRQGRGLWLASMSLSSATFLGIGLAYEAADRRWEHAHPLVILKEDKVFLHKGDGGSYPVYDATNKKWLDAAGAIPPAATPLNRGVEARLRFDKGPWVQIELASGEIGWVRRQEVLVDESAG